MTLRDPQHAEDSPASAPPPLHHSIVLIVMEAFSLTPQSPVLLLPRAVLQFGLRTFRKGVLKGRCGSHGSLFLSAGLHPSCSALLASIPLNQRHMHRHSHRHSRVSYSLVPSLSVSSLFQMYTSHPPTMPGPPPTPLLLLLTALLVSYRPQPEAHAPSQSLTPECLGTNS